MALARSSPASGPDGTLVIRPSWASLGRWEWHLVGLMTVLLALITVRVLLRYPTLAILLMTLTVFGVALACYATFVTTYMLGTSITVTGDAVLVRHWFWSTVTVMVRDIARVVRCSVRSDSEALARPAVFVLSPTGRCLISLYAFRWDPVDLDRIWQHLGVTPEGSWDDAIEDDELSARFPGAF